MKTNFFKLLSGSTVAAIAALGLAACDVDKTQDGELPEVKIQVDGEAKLPKYDVNGPDVTVGKKKVEMEVPTVDIDIPKEGDNEPAKKEE